MVSRPGGLSFLGRSGRTRRREIVWPSEGNGELVAREDRKRPGDVPARGARSRKSEDASGGTVGEALRSVYDETVKEDIPSEMLDLLGKLT
jgi:hypothetical protein